MTVKLKLPNGTRIEESLNVLSTIEKEIRKNWESTPVKKRTIKNWISYVGEGGPRFVLNYAPEISAPHYAFMLVNLERYEDMLAFKKELEDFCFQNFPDLIATVRTLDNGPPVQSPISIRIHGKNFESLYKVSEEVENKLASIKGSKNVKDNWGARSKRLFIDIDSVRARRAALSNQEIAIALKTSVSGFEVGSFREEDKQIPILLRSKNHSRQSLSQLESINVISHKTGQSTPLKQVADIDLKWQPSKIIRRDQKRTISVESELADNFTAHSILQKLKPWLESVSKKWPEDLTYSIGGSEERSAESNAAIVEKLPIAAFIIVMLLILQFNSIRKSAIILITIPLGVIGSIAGLFLCSSYFGFMTLLGIISLAGIVVNNAIVLIDRIDLEIAEGQSPQNAILRATETRMRPILLTTLTTVGGLIPLWLSGGAMWEPMAIAIIFGLIFSTLLTLIGVPVLYSLFFKVRF